MAGKVKQKGSGTKKFGRNEAKCTRYKLQHRREKNKIKRIRKHLKVHKNNLQAVKRIVELEALIKNK